MTIMTVVSSKKSWQIPVPAAAAKQEGLALFSIIGRKGCVGGFFDYCVKF
jgi:hypothetical protein